MNNRIHQIRVNNVVAEITKENTCNGTTTYKVNIGKPKLQSDKQNFNRDELLDVVQVADQAHTWIHKKMFLCDPKKEVRQFDPN